MTPQASFGGQYVHNDVFESHLDNDAERQTLKDVVKHNDEYTLEKRLEGEVIELILSPLKSLEVAYIKLGE